jgi:hypothetical protein
LIIQKKKKKPRFLADGAASSDDAGGVASSSSSVKSHDGNISSGGGGGGSSSNSRKRKHNGSTADHNKGSNKKVAPSTETTHTHRVDHPEVATIQPKTIESTSTSVMMIDATSNTAASEQAESLHNDNPVPVGKAAAALATAKGAAVGLAGLTQQEIVELSYRPDSAAEKDFPVIPLPRSTDVIMGRGSRVAKHQ